MKPFVVQREFNYLVDKNNGLVRLFRSVCKSISMNIVAIARALIGNPKILLLDEG